MKRQLIIGNYNYSSWSLRAWLALRKTGIDFEEIRIPLFEEDFRERILRFSPAGKVPVFCDGEITVWDSLAICDYLADQYAPLWPEEQAARAMARSVAAEMHAGFPQLRSAMPMNCRAMGRKVRVGADLKAEIRRVCDIWTECRSRFGHAGNWLFGAFSVADAMYAPVVFRFRTYGVDVPDICQRYMQHVLQDDDVRQWVNAALQEPETIPQYELETA